MTDRTIVVGAGSTGSSTAFHLARLGIPVTLVDRGEIAHGMTSRSTAIVRTNYSNEIVAKMALYSLKILRGFLSVGNSGFTQCGMLILVSDTFTGTVKDNVKMLKKVGIKEVELSRSQTKESFPDLYLEDCGDYFAYEPESGYADPVATAGAYAARARELGADVILRNGVKRLEITDQKITSILLEDGTRLKCSTVILCTNIWTNKVLSSSGVEDSNLLPIRTVPHPVVVYRRPTGYQGTRVIISDYYSKAYYKPEGQTLLFGGSIDASIDSQTCDPDNPPSDVPFEYVSTYSDQISKRIPAMKDAEFHSAYIGMYDVTPDEHPIIDDLSSSLGIEGLYCCVGLSGHGFKLCPALGMINAEMILDKEPTEQAFDRSHFALDRFKTGKLLSTKYAGLGTVA